MIETISQALGGVSDGVVYALIGFAVLQIGLQLWALVDLARRDRVQFGMRWLWLVIILVLSSAAVGAILYLVWGRKAPEPVEAPAEKAHPSSDRTKATVEALYGSEGGF